MPSTQTGHPFKFETSVTEKDSAATRTMTELWLLNSEPHVMPENYTKYEDDNESGKSSNLSEAAPIPYRADWGRTLNMAADDHALAYWPFLASHGSGAGNTTSNQTVVGATAAYEGHWTGPVADPDVFVPVDGIEYNSDDSGYKSEVENIIVPSVEIHIPNAGPGSVNVQTLGGGEVGLSPSTAGTNKRNRVFTKANMALLASTSLGVDGTPTYATTAFANATGPADAATYTYLNGTAVPLQAYCIDFKARLLNGIDLDTSYSGGSADGSGNAVVPYNGWVRDSSGQQIEFEMTFLQGAAATITNLRAGFKAGTQMGFEFWLIHPSAIAAGAYGGIRISCGFMKPVGNLVPGGDTGAQTWTATYRAQYNTTDGFGWNMLTCSTLATSIGS